MHTPDTEREALKLLMAQTENDLAAAHAEICNLAGLDPKSRTWPQWSSQANTLRWIEALREKFNIDK
jgi:hypothetical protein